MQKYCLSAAGPLLGDSPQMYEPLNFSGGKKPTSVYGNLFLQTAKKSRSHMV